MRGATGKGVATESSPTPVSQRRPSTRGFALDLLRMSRPQFWLVSLVPYLFGVLLASHLRVPSALDLVRIATGAAVIGPMMWFSALALNDACDLPGDRLNPRKQNFPLVAGRVKPRQARRWSWLTGAAGIAAGTAISIPLGIGVAITCALSWAYSSPPLRLKEKGFADAAANAIGVGLIAPLSGWSVLQPVQGFPWIIAALGVLMGAALYLPSAAIDYASDMAAGYATSAVRMGRRATFWAGVGLWGTASMLSVAACWLNVTIPRRLLPTQCVVVVVMTAAYVALNRRPSFGKMAVLSSLFLLCSAAFVASYIGTA